MFGKINLFSNLKSNSIQQNSQAQSLSNSFNNNNNNNRPFLSNPKFVSNFNKNSKKQVKNDDKDNKNIQKTKFIKKQQKGHNNNNNNDTKAINNTISKHQQYKKTIANNNNNNNNNKNKPFNNPSTNPSSKFTQQLQGSKFRILNQLLYSNTSQYAMQYFSQNQQDYLIYHQGYKHQSQKWQSKPVNLLIKYFRKNYKQYKEKKIIDLGCGEGFLYQGLTREQYEKVTYAEQGGKKQNKLVEMVKNKHVFPSINLLSYDLVAIKPFITVADIKKLPLKTQSIDCAVFCLSLMGKNYLEFIKQANRVLINITGELFIAQVQSRSKNWKVFIQMIEMIGFELINDGVSLGVKNTGKNHDKNHDDDQYHQKADRKWHKNGQKGWRSNNNQEDKNVKGRYFRIMHFVKNKEQYERITKVRYQNQNYGRDKLPQLSQMLLTECIYKKR